MTPTTRRSANLGWLLDDLVERVPPVRQTVVELESAFFMVTSAGHGTCLAVLAGSDADLGLIAYEMAMLVTRVGRNLSAPDRAPSDVP